jgi:Nucleotide-diphospho-sugar transferase
MTMMLGYDVLFQDVDIVWYRNPIQYFHDKPGKVS